MNITETTNRRNKPIKQIKMKNQLKITNQGVRGGKNHHTPGGYGLFTLKEEGTEVLSISIDLFEGAGSSYEERVNPKIEIYFPNINGQFHFVGTLQELKKKLFPKKQ